MSDVVLAVRGVTRRWHKQPEPVLHDIDFELTAGQVAWVGGANGAGKTTLLRIVCGLLAPSEGEITIRGLSITEHAAQYRAELGFLSAGDRGLVARLSVREHLRLWCRMAFVPPENERAAIQLAVELLELEQLMDRRVDRLSLGQRQRVRIAMSFMHDPSMLVLDEPRNSLDDAGYASLNQVITHVANKGGAVLWCAPRGEDRVLPYDRGFVIAGGELQERT